MSQVNNSVGLDDAVEAAPSKDPAVRQFAIAAMLIGFGLYTVYDHYILGNFQDGPDINTHWKYLFNHYLPYLLLPAGSIALGIGIRGLRRRLLANNTGIGYKGGQLIAWNDIQQVDARLLPSKGYITIVHGQGRKFKIDSYCFQNVKAVVAYIERQVPADKIVRS